MKIEVQASVSSSQTTQTFDLEDLGYTEQEWHDLEHDEQQAVLQKAIDELPDQPYWLVEKHFNI